MRPPRQAETTCPSTSCCSLKRDKLQVAMSQESSWEPVIKHVQDKRHGLWSSSGVTAPFVEQSTASKGDWSPYPRIPKCIVGFIPSEPGRKLSGSQVSTLIQSSGKTKSKVIMLKLPVTERRHPSQARRTQWLPPGKTTRRW